MSVRLPVIYKTGLLLTAWLVMQPLAACELQLQALSFGVYDIFSPVPSDSISQLEISCAPDTLFRVSLDAGNTTLGFERQMQSLIDTDRLRYNLFVDAGYQTIWGDGSAGTVTRSHLSTALPAVLPLYGRIYPLQNVRPGQYRDAIIITVEW